MNNRLGDLPAWADDDIDDEEEGENEEDEEEDIEKGKVKSKQEVDKEIFFAAVEQIKNEITQVQRATANIQKINEEAQKATTTEKEQELSKKLRSTIDKTNKQAKAAKNLLGELKHENEQLKKQKEVTTSDLRVRENLLNTLTRKFIDEMKAYQAAQQQYKTDIQNKMKRQVLVVKPDATDQEVEEIMKSEGGRDALYKQTILAGGVNDEITTVTAKVAGKYQDVKTLEQSVAELHQMFLDFALLVEQQGELLNNIEHQVRQAADHVEEANKDVHQSIEIQKSIRKKQIWIILIVIVCLVIVLFATGILP
mmetsp:Transcript_21202/g.35092  ORF Transcript_21202/g.35092 Transcript_21202/m.35092 type:complete len:310 (+) Transcript_21202:246-1175(+)|eukprot:CAMPEP_0119029602 /NCGR_PEP_ID=MMETSP1176-20130426/40603_1 /TAXON_ID=265551 /ORGANISM="Synedropsis recta cf, Strain CCMP1620" /LENGTH=309 /DNA_ID=CAMNT_0006985951 /DNA_START=243 /DNA_END=1172 /DNA_ORIENTATION=+